MICMIMMPPKPTISGYPFHHPVDFLGVLQNDHIPIFQLRRASDNADIIIFGSTRNRVTGVCGNIDVRG